MSKKAIQEESEMECDIAMIRARLGSMGWELMRDDYDDNRAAFAIARIDFLCGASRSILNARQFQNWEEFLVRELKQSLDQYRPREPQ